MVRRLGTMFAVAAVALFGLTACSDGGGTDDPGQTSDDVSTDATGEQADTSSCSPPTCSFVKDRFKSESVPSCSDSEPPSRCGDDVISFEGWGPASVVTNLTLPEGADTDIGFDMNQQAGVDNALGTILGSVSGGGGGGGGFGLDVDTQIKQSLLSGELILLAEHQGLSSIPSDGSFQSNFMFGAPADESAQSYISKVDSSCEIGGETECELQTSSGENFLVNPESFEAGVYPQAFVGDATIEDGQLSAGPGTVILNIQAPSLGQISLTLSGATIEADVETTSLSNGETGVELTNGEIGGYLKARQLYALGNSVFSGCGCLGSPDTIFELPSGDQEICDSQSSGSQCVAIDGCKDSIDANACNTDDHGSLCGNAGLACTILPQVVPRALDLDTDEDGNKDALSLGIAFEAVGANIEGTTPGISVQDQSGDGGSATVSQVISPTAGSVAIVEQGNDYTAGNVLGSATIEAGTNSDVTVDFESSLSSTKTLEAVLFDDSGSSEGGYDSGDSVVTYGPGIQTFESFTLRVSGGG